jgi:hypothetical protein
MSAEIFNFTDGSIAGQMIPSSYAKIKSKRTPIRRIEPIDQHVFLLRNVVDCTKQTLDVSEVDVAQALVVEAGTTVLDCWCRVTTAEGSGAILNLGYGSDVDRWGHELPMDATGLIATLLSATATWNAGSIADGDEEAKEVTVDGARLGDIATAYYSIDVADLALTAAVTAADTVTAQLLNNTGGAVDLASATLSVLVNKAPLRQVPLYFSSADTIDFSSAGTVDCDGLIVEVYALCCRVA